MILKKVGNIFNWNTSENVIQNSWNNLSFEDEYIKQRNLIDSSYDWIST